MANIGSWLGLIAAGLLTFGANKYFKRKGERGMEKYGKDQITNPTENKNLVGKTNFSKGNKGVPGASSELPGDTSGKPTDGIQPDDAGQGSIQNKPRKSFKPGKRKLKRTRKTGKSHRSRITRI